MEFDTAIFYWIKEHLQSPALDIWIQIFTDKYMVSSWEFCSAGLTGF